MKVVTEAGIDARQLSFCFVLVKPLHMVSSKRSLMAIPISVSGQRKLNYIFSIFFVLSFRLTIFLINFFL